MTPASAIAPGGLLGQHFRGPSWDRWRAVLKAAFGEPLTDTEDALFREVAERDPPTSPVSELWCVAGRRAGKDSIASALATVAALGDYSEQLRPGEKATVLCLASTRDQSSIVFGYIRAFFEKIPSLAALVKRATDETITLTNGAEIVVSTNSFRAVRGRSVVVAILDEVAYYRSDESANPDSELYNAILPAMATFPNALLIGISSPYRRQGLLYTKWVQSYGKPDPDTLVVRGASLTFNATLPQKIVDARLAADPEAGAAEYLAAWRDDLSGFLDRELVESAIDVGVRVRPPHRQCDYRMFIDSSGGRGDAFTATVAHGEGDVAVLDAIYERRSPFNPTDVVKEVADLAKSYGVSRVTGDRYSAQWVVEAFAKEGITYETSERDRSAIYLDALPLFTSGRIRMLDDARLTHQFVSLERRVSRFGKDGVNHPEGGADDIANAAAGAAVLAASDKRPALVNPANLLNASGAPLPLPTGCQCVFACVATNRTGDVAVIYFARPARPVFLDGVWEHPMFVLDFDAGALRPSLFIDVRNRALELGAAVGVGLLPSGEPAVFASWDPSLERQSHVSGLPSVSIPKYLTGDLDGMFISASLPIKRGLVKLCAPAVEKAKTSPFGGALDFRGGDKEDDALRRAALWAIALAFDKQ